MSSLPSKHPSLAIHLSDRNLHPILTSAQSDVQLEALTSLATTSLTSHAAAQRLALGEPQRLIVEHGPGSPVFLTSYLDSTAEHSSPSSSALNAASSSSDTGAQSNAEQPLRSRTSPGTHRATATPTVPTEAFAATSISDFAEGQPVAAGSSTPRRNPSPPAHHSSKANGASTPSQSSSRSRPHTRDASTVGPGASITGQTSSCPGSAKPKAEANGKRTKLKGGDTRSAPPLLGLVVAGSAEEALEARRAAVRVERVGREVQREWAASAALTERGDQRPGSRKGGKRCESDDDEND